MSEPNGRVRVAGYADAAFIDAVHAALAGLWADVPDVSLEDQTMFGLAVAEIAANIVTHAEDDGRVVEVALDLAADEASLTALFTDSGIPPVLDLSRVSMPEDDAESGRGLAIALAALDELEHLPENGNAWRLLRRRAGTRRSLL